MTDEVQKDVAVKTENQVNLDDYVSKDRVNSILQERLSETKQSVEKKLREEYDQKISDMQSQAQSQAEPDRASLREMLREEMQTQQELARKSEHERQLHDVVNSYNTKMSEGSSLYDDFDETISKIKPEQFGNSVFYATQMDNTANLMYELAKNPQKMVDIETAAQYSPELAQRMVRDLSKSISSNQQAKSESSRYESNAPLSRLKHSQAKADSGNPVLRDMKKDKFFRV